jgi:hypothetical protein
MVIYDALEHRTKGKTIVATKRRRKSEYRYIMSSCRFRSVRLWGLDSGVEARKQATVAATP